MLNTALLRDLDTLRAALDAAREGLAPVAAPVSEVKKLVYIKPRADTRTNLWRARDGEIAGHFRDVTGNSLPKDAVDADTLDFAKMDEKERRSIAVAARQAASEAKDPKARADALAVADRATRAAAADKAGAEGGSKPTKGIAPDTFSGLSKADRAAQLDAYKKLDRHQRLALGIYEARGYGPMNVLLRTGKVVNSDAKPAPEIKDKIKRAVDDLQAALHSNELPPDLLTYRAVSLKGHPLRDQILAPGAVWKDRGFTSTSRTLNGLKAFEKHANKGGDGYLMVVRAPKGTKGLAIEKQAVRPEETEVLMPAGTSFRTTEIKEIDGRKVVFVDVVSQDIEAEVKAALLGLGLDIKARGQDADVDRWNGRHNLPRQGVEIVRAAGEVEEKRLIWIDTHPNARAKDGDTDGHWRHVDNRAKLPANARDADKIDFTAVADDELARMSRAARANRTRNRESRDQLTQVRFAIEREVTKRRLDVRSGTRSERAANRVASPQPPKGRGESIISKAAVDGLRKARELDAERKKLTESIYKLDSAVWSREWDIRSGLGTDAIRAEIAAFRQEASVLRSQRKRIIHDIQASRAPAKAATDAAIARSRKSDADRDAVAAAVAAQAKIAADKDERQALASIKRAIIQAVSKQRLDEVLGSDDKPKIADIGQMSRTQLHALYRKVHGREPGSFDYVTASMLIADIYGLDPDILSKVDPDRFASGWIYPLRNADPKALDAVMAAPPEDRTTLFAVLSDRYFSKGTKLPKTISAQIKGLFGNRSRISFELYRRRMVEAHLADLKSKKDSWFARVTGFASSPKNPDGVSGQEYLGQELVSLNREIEEDAERNARFVTFLKGGDYHRSDLRKSLAPLPNGFDRALTSDEAKRVDQSVRGLGIDEDGDAVKPTPWNQVADGPIDGWHGSAARFDRFDIGKLNTGEGAQAFGWGLYFAERRSIAEWYARTVSERQTTRDNTKIQPTLYRVRLDVDRKRLLNYDLGIDEQTAEVRAALGQLGVSTSAVDTGVKIEPLSEWSERVIPASVNRIAETGFAASFTARSPSFENEGQDLAWETATATAYVFQTKSGRWTGTIDRSGGRARSFKTPAEARAYAAKLVENHFKALVMQASFKRALGVVAGNLGESVDENSKTVADALQSVGIQGIIFADAGSRGPDDDDKEKASNIVIFDDKLVEIKETIAK